MSRGMHLGDTLCALSHKDRRPRDVNQRGVDNTSNTCDH